MLPLNMMYGSASTVLDVGHHGFTTATLSRLQDRAIRALFMAMLVGDGEDAPDRPSQALWNPFIRRSARW